MPSIAAPLHHKSESPGQACPGGLETNQLHRMPLTSRPPSSRAQNPAHRSRSSPGVTRVLWQVHTAARRARAANEPFLLVRISAGPAAAREKRHNQANPISVVHHNSEAPQRTILKPHTPRQTSRLDPVTEPDSPAPIRSRFAQLEDVAGVSRGTVTPAAHSDLTSSAGQAFLAGGLAWSA
jgi:hypothetical protein